MLLLLALGLGVAPSAFVTADTATGLVVVQARILVQVLAPEEMVQVEEAGVRVPVIPPVDRQMVPFQLVPAAQVAVAVAVASCIALLFKKNDRVPYETLAEPVPLFAGPPTTVFATGVLEVTLETPSGFVVVQFKVEGQLLLPAGI